MARDGETKGPSSGARRFWLEHEGQNIELRRGQLLVGRSSGCHLVLEDTMVSRRHAEFVVAEEFVTLNDLGSVNGIFVNGRKLSGSQRLKDGDRVQIGQREFLLRSVAREAVPALHERTMAETLHGNSSEVHREESEDQTHVGDVFDVLGSVADKVLALERGDEAERILSGVLLSVLRDANDGRDVAPHVAERAAAYAVRIAGATGRATWLDYTVNLYGRLGRLLPASVVDQLYGVVRKARGMNVGALRAYVEQIGESAAGYGPSERFVLQRLAGLERVILS